MPAKLLSMPLYLHALTIATLFYMVLPSCQAQSPATNSKLRCTPSTTSEAQRPCYAPVEATALASYESEQHSKPACLTSKLCMALLLPTLAMW